MEVLIVTALTEEHQVVTAVLNEKATFIGQDINQVGLYDFNLNGESSCRIGICCAHQMGATKMGAFVAPLFMELMPKTTVLIGIAAAVNQSDTKLGDVPYSSHVLSYDDIAVENGIMTFRSEGYQTSPEMRKAVGLFRSSVITYAPWRSECVNVIHKVIVSLNKLRKPQIISPQALEEPHLVVEVTAGGPFLIRDAVFRDTLKKIPTDGTIKTENSVHPKLVSVEMESHGFMNAAHEHGIPAYVMKGISDDGDEKKSALEKETGGFYRAYASSNAVLAVLHILQCNLQITNTNQLESKDEKQISKIDAGNQKKCREKSGTVKSRPDNIEPFQIWDNRAMVSLGPYSEERHCLFNCPFCYVNSSYLSFRRKDVRGIIDWLKSHKGEFDIVYISGDTDSFAGKSRQKEAVELIEAIEYEFDVEIMITTRAIIENDNLERLKIVKQKLKQKGLNFYACVSISQLNQKEDLEPKPIPSVNKRIEQLERFKKAGMKTILAMRPFLPVVPDEDYLGILELCKPHIDIVLGKEWYADNLGLMDNAISCGRPLKYPSTVKRMNFDTNIALWKVYSPKELKRKIRDWCDQSDIPFFMTSRPAVDWVRASEPRTAFPRVIGIGALNINFFPKNTHLEPLNLNAVAGEETETSEESLWEHIESFYGPDFIENYDFFLGGGAYHAIECLSELDIRHKEMGARNLELEYIGVAGKTIEKMFYKEKAACNFDIIEKLISKNIGVKYIKKSKSKPGITINYWSGTSSEAGKALRTNLTGAGSNKELEDYLDHLCRKEPFFLKRLAAADWIHISSLFDNRAMSVVAELLTGAKKINLGLRVSWDVGKLIPSLLNSKQVLRRTLRAADFVIVNPNELRVLANSTSEIEKKLSNHDVALKLYTDLFPEANFALVVQSPSLDQVEFYWRYKHEIVSQGVNWKLPTNNKTDVNVTAASAYLAAALIDSQLRPDLGFNMNLAANYGMELVWAKVTNSAENRGKKFRQVRKNYIEKAETPPY
ncbi:hypothetical protein D0S45_19705 [Marinifilum sp. JC120]|nr:hypothetical protein D0S45_19705 [Marinifilum sp. JC120]